MESFFFCALKWKSRQNAIVNVPESNFRLEA